MAQSLINGNKFSWTSIEVRAAGRMFPGMPFRSINYSVTKTRSKVFGEGCLPIGRTRGQLEAEASFEMLVSDFDDMMNFFSVQVGDRINLGVGDFEFDIQVAYSENDGTDTRIDELFSCSIQKISLDNSQGTEPTVVKCELSVMDVSLNGNKMAGISSGPVLGVSIGVL